MLHIFIALALSVSGDNDQPQRFISGKGSGLMARACRLLGDERNLRYGLVGGNVVEVTEDTLTIRTFWFHSPTGFSRTFEVSPAPASKRIPLERRYALCWHRLNQVRVGDSVSCRVVPTPRGYVVVAIGIGRRPGGLVPPAEDTFEPEEGRIHNVLNKLNAKKYIREDTVLILARFFATKHR